MSVLKDRDGNILIETQRRLDLDAVDFRISSIMMDRMRDPGRGFYVNLDSRGEVQIHPVVDWHLPH